MPKHIEVITPENVKIQYELAGLASRGTAAVLDMLIQGLIIGSIYLLVKILFGDNILFLSGLAKAILGVVVFLIYYGYFMYFETVTNGQTPGKRCLKLRTIKENGSPINLESAALRNLIRIVDFLPMVYAIGSIFVFFSSKNQRLGDFAAGTIVVKIRPEMVRDLTLAKGYLDNKAPYIPYQNNTGCVFSVDQLSKDECHAVKQFNERKQELNENIREQLAEKLARPIIEKLGINVTNELKYADILNDIYNKCRENNMF